MEDITSAFGVDQSVERGPCIFNEYINKCTRVAKGRDEVEVKRMMDLVGSKKYAKINV